jgi:hypothetical protein
MDMRNGLPEAKRLGAGRLSVPLLGGFVVAGFAIRYLSHAPM